MTDRDHRLARALRQACRQLSEARATPDAELLARFLDDQDEAAFALLVHRHGPMVLGVCRRVLGHDADAEDAFQAAFLVLARQAAAIGKRASLGSWLYGVAYRVALRLRTQRDRRRRHEQRAAALAVRFVAAEADDWLDAEIQRLPAKYRRPIVLCYLEGKSHAEAARELGWPVGTVAGRLARARDLLRVRLVRRGLAAVALGLAAGEAAAAVSPTLVQATVATAVRSVTGPAAVLAEGVLRSMFLTKLKFAALAVTLAALLGAGVGALGLTAGAQDPAAGPPAQPPGAQATLQGHTGPVHSVAFSPDGAILATGAGDGTVHVWDVGSGRARTVLKADAGAVWSVTFAPDGRQLTTGGGDAKVRVWDVASGQLTQTWTGHEALVGSVAFSPDGKRVASGSADGTVRVWDAATGKLIDTNQAPAAGPNAPPARTVVAYAPDGKHLAIGMGPKTFLLEAATGRVLWLHQGAAGPVESLTFSPDGKGLVIAGGDQSVHLLDAVTGRELRRLAGPARAVHGVAFSPDGRLLATAGDGVVLFWDVATGKGLRTLPGAGDRALSLAISPDGKWLATGNSDHTVRLWQLAEHPEKVNAAGEVEVLFTRARLEPDVKLHRDQFVARQVPATVAGTWVRSADFAAKVEGKVVRTPVAQGMPLTADMLSTWEPVLRPGEVAQTIRIAKDDPAAGFLQPECRVDVQVTTQRNTPEGPRPFTQVILKDVEVLAVNVAPRPDEEVRQGELKVTLRVTRDHTNLLAAYVDAPNAIRLLLRPQGDHKQYRPEGRLPDPFQPGAPAAGVPVPVPVFLNRLLDDLARNDRTPEAQVEAVFLATLGRLPTEAETRLLAAELGKAGDRSRRLAKLAQDLTDTSEFRAHADALQKAKGAAKP